MGGRTASSEMDEFLHEGVLTRFATDPSLRLRIRFDVAPEAGISQPQLEEVKMALRELGLDAERLKAEGSE